jgi:hypothetical protein
MNALRQAAQELVDRVSNLGVQRQAWQEYNALKEALAAPEQEPVATVIAHQGVVTISGMGKWPEVGTKLYAATPDINAQKSVTSTSSVCSG